MSKPKCVYVPHLFALSDLICVPSAILMFECKSTYNPKYHSNGDPKYPPSPTVQTYVVPPQSSTIPPSTERHQTKSTIVNRNKPTLHIHQSENSICIVTCRAVDGLSEEELKDELQDQGVIDVRRLGKGGKSATMVVTVRGTVAPNEIFFGYEVFTTRDYKQGPMQCFRCYDFGHTKGRCQVEELCRNCSKAHKITKDVDGKTVCEAETRCKHCNGAHSPTSRTCPKYREEEEVNDIRIKEDKSAREARRLYEKRKANEGSSYASMAASGPT